MKILDDEEIRMIEQFFDQETAEEMVEKIENAQYRLNALENETNMYPDIDKHLLSLEEYQLIAEKLGDDSREIIHKIQNMESIIKTLLMKMQQIQDISYQTIKNL